MEALILIALFINVFKYVENNHKIGCANMDGQQNDAPDHFDKTDRAKMVSCDSLKWCTLFM
jgi:hypothetical protein